jgi:hypothetical protein
VHKSRRRWEVGVVEELLYHAKNKKSGGWGLNSFDGGNMLLKIGHGWAEVGRMEMGRDGRGHGGRVVGLGGDRMSLYLWLLYLIVGGVGR